MKKLMEIAIAVLLVLVVVIGCSAPAEKSAASEPATENVQPAEAPAEQPNEQSSEEPVGNDKPVIGISVSGFAAPYFKALIAAAEMEAEAQGVELKVLDAEWDSQKQATQVESLIAAGCDVIEIIPCDSTAIIPTMEKVNAAGIPLVVVNTQHDPASEDLIVTFVGASMEDEAAMAAEAVKEILGAEGGKVVIVEGAAGSFPAIHRTSGFLAAIEGANIEVLANQNAGWDRATAMAVMEDFLTAYPDIDALYAHDDNMVIGCIQAIKDAGREDEIKVVSISGTIEGYDAIRNGELYSTVSQPPDWEGMMAVQVAVGILNGEEYPKWVKTPIAQVTAENVDKFKGVW